MPRVPLALTTARRLRLAWGAAALCLLTLLTLTHVPMKPAPPDAPLNDGYEHFIAYFGLGATVAFACLLTWPRRWWLMGVVFIGGAVLGAADELTQPLTGRTCDPRDWRNDLLGLAAAVIVVPVGLKITRALGRRSAAG